MAALKRAAGAALLLALAANAPAQEEDWDDWEDEPATLWSGYLELAHSSRLDRNPLFDERATRSELKGQVEVGHAGDGFELSGKLDVHVDAVADELDFDLREALLSLPLGARAHLQAGRQVLSWGLGDLLFINDRFPKDFVTPLAGGEDFYFKAPSDTLRLALSGWVNVDLAWTPTFTPDRYIDGSRLGFFDPGSGTLVGGADLVRAREPHPDLAGGEWALRVHRSADGVEYAGYAYRGHDKQPLGADADGRPAHWRRDSAGFSVRAPFAGGIVSLEAGREWPREPSGVPAWVPAKSAWMLAYEKEWLPKFTAGVQLYGEHHADASGNASALAGADRHLVSLRLTRQALRDKLLLSAIQFWSPDQHDRWLRATASYRIDDRWLVGASANLFGGAAARFFGQLDPEDNAGLWLRRQF